jgi:hypothetical protein
MILRSSFGSLLARFKRKILEFCASHCFFVQMELLQLLTHQIVEWLQPLHEVPAAWKIHMQLLLRMVQLTIPNPTQH